MSEVKKKAIIQRKNRNARRRAKRDQDKLKSKKPHRTPNRFMLYRKHIQELFFNDPEHPNDMRKLSTKIGKMWKNEPPEIKQHWDRKAAKLKLMSSYRSSFDRVRGLNMTISEDELPFVNATASSSTTAAAANNENYGTAPLSFIIESPESGITSNSEYSECLDTDSLDTDSPDTDSIDTDSVDTESIDTPPQMVESPLASVSFDDDYFSPFLYNSFPNDEDYMMDNSLINEFFDFPQYGELPPLFIDESYQL
ncbi:17627_t:CDS:1 [Funneliformis geosporum]|uniref:11571_t:CDS:1 n=1 Tax=Funneliformis geosporum TaxID=1117311 RepID=A0A9W4SKU6_9GLOM|nr:11571_t:CDS:1 [Funneliformis geosporum]CAI2176435.1 17627_t:CDS:1 [Funneliformis geosporum]